METSAPPPAGTLPPFKGDRVMAFVIGAAALMSLVVCFLAFSASSFQNSFDSVEREASRGHPSNASATYFPENHFLETYISAFGAIFLVVAFLQIVCAIGVYMGSRKALILTVAVAVISLFTGICGLPFGIIIGIYAVQRLWGGLGPRQA